MMSPEDIDFEAYRHIFSGAESILEDWIDEEGEYDTDEFLVIYDRAFELLKELRGKYLYGDSEEEKPCRDLSGTE